MTAESHDEAIAEALAKAVYFAKTIIHHDHEAHWRDAKRLNRNLWRGVGNAVLAEARRLAIVPTGGEFAADITNANLRDALIHAWNEFINDTESLPSGMRVVQRNNVEWDISKVESSFFDYMRGYLVAAIPDASEAPSGAFAAGMRAGKPDPIKTAPHPPLDPEIIEAAKRAVAKLNSVCVGQICPSPNCVCGQWAQAALSVAAPMLIAAGMRRAAEIARNHYATISQSVADEILAAIPAAPAPEGEIVGLAEAIEALRSDVLIDNCPNDGGFDPENGPVGCELVARGKYCICERVHNGLALVETLASIRSRPAAEPPAFYDNPDEEVQGRRAIEQSDPRNNPAAEPPGCPIPGEGLASAFERAIAKLEAASDAKALRIAQADFSEEVSAYADDFLAALRAAEAQREVVEALRPFADIDGEGDEDFPEDQIVVIKFGRTTGYSIRLEIYAAPAPPSPVSPTPRARKEPDAMTEIENYALALLTEECGEVLQLIGKAGRFGIDTPGVKDPLTGVVDMTVTPRTKLVEECGDLIAAIEYLTRRGVIDGDGVARRSGRKLDKLLNPESKDNLGRRLAP